MNVEINNNLFRQFADILEYPQPGFREAVYDCEVAITAKDSAAGALLRIFSTYVKKSSLEKMQEVYTTTFDLGATYHPYMGYHLLGESYKRSAFMLELKDRFRAEGFTPREKELPDHLAVILRFMSICRRDEEIRELACEGILPVLNKMLKENQTEGADNDRQSQDFANDLLKDSDEEQRQTGPYKNVLQALRLVLRQYDIIEKEEESYV